MCDEATDAPDVRIEAMALTQEPTDRNNQVDEKKKRRKSSTPIVVPGGMLGIEGASRLFVLLGLATLGLGGATELLLAVLPLLACEKVECQQMCCAGLC